MDWIFFSKNNKLTFHLFGIPEQHNHQDWRVYIYSTKPFLFLDIFYQNFPIHFLNSKPVNSEQKFTIIKFDCISLNKALELISTYCGRQGNALRNDVMNVSDERSERSLKITKCFISIL